MNRKDIEGFFRTLLLGDFEEGQQNTSAMIVGGLISMIPVLDQVLDVRDIAGSIYRVNNKGGFDKATTDDVVTVAFAAFGAVPAVGSAFKTAFKPMWNNRRAAKGMVQGGMKAIESMLGLGKGGAVTWVRKEVLGKWAGRTQEAIAKANEALEAVISLNRTIANLKGWKDWLVPDSIQALARALLPGLTSMRGKLAAPLERGSREIRELLEDLLGERAAAVVMAVGQRAVPASAIPGTRPRNGHNAAALKPKGNAPARQKPKTTGPSPTTEVKPGAGSKHSGVQATGTLIDIGNAVLGVSGEHIADYICAKKFGWGKGWKEHDAGNQGRWSSKPDKDTVGKLSKGGSPKVAHALYKLTDGANGTGIDAVWRAEGHNGGKPYAIVEAKASADEDGPKFMRRKNNTRKPSVASKLGVSGAVDPSQLLEPLDDAGSASAGGKGKPGGGKPGGGKPGAGKPKATTGTGNSASGTSQSAGARPSKSILVQMSREWIRENLESAVGSLAADIRRRGYTRHLFFSPLYHPCAERHAEARLKGEAAATHADHDAIHYTESEIKIAVNKRKASLRGKYGPLPSLSQES
ncbi:hypothetical protein [Pseudorhodoferax sp.]|uniref:hypothetical protein n=1 Tax=Pseudorhodoferax sp. TaxID=1993553 RepID=UPI0039E60884